MPSLIKKGRKNGDAAPAGMQEAAGARNMDAEPMEPPMEASAPPPPQQAPTMVQRQAPSGPGSTATYVMPGTIDFDPPMSYEPAPKPPPSPRSTGSLLNRVLGDPGESTPEERDRAAAMEFEQAIAPVMDLMRAAVPDASTPEEAERILAQNQGEITPDPKGGSYIHGDSFDRDARVYYRLLRRNYEKNPRPSEKRPKSHHLHELYGKLTGNKGW